MKLCVATPMYGGNCTAGYASSLLNLSKLIKFEHNFIANESLVTRARNMLTHAFLESDCTHMLFIDADVAFDAHGVVKMLESDKNLIGGLYAKKHIDWQRVFNMAKQVDSAQQLAANAYDYYVRGNVQMGTQECVEVESVATGLMLIKRDVFAALKSSTPASKLGSAVLGQISAQTLVHHYFDTGLDAKTGEFLSEDYAFCQKWKRAGGKVYAAPWIKTIHIGTHNFG
jgi:hypothetical protein